MAQIIFLHHPGDILELHEGLKTRIHLGNFMLEVIRIRLLPHDYFAVEINVPSNKISREAVTTLLNYMLSNGEINSYSLAG